MSKGTKIVLGLVLNGTHSERSDRRIINTCMCCTCHVAVKKGKRQTKECRKNACGTQFRFIKQTRRA